MIDMMKLSEYKLETPRLFLIPLDYGELLKYWKSDGSLELNAGLTPGHSGLSEEMLIVIERSIIPFLCLFPKLVLFGTLWIMVHKTRNVIVGDIGFKGGPTDKGLIEVGYATYPDFYNQGFMTEALGSISNWAFNQPDVKIILAETDKTNLASQRILHKNRFLLFAETADEYWWRLDRNIDETVG